MKAWQDFCGTLECCGFGVRMEVEEGLNGVVEEGVTRAFRLVFILSSMRDRERRRKERREECEKQNCGVRLGGGEGGRDIMRGRGEGGVV